MEKNSFGSRTSIRWCGTPCISSCVILPLPRSSPRKTCRESAEMISAPYRFASSTPSALLPEAFVPTTATTLG